MSGATDLARRAVACKAWRWMPGMLAQWRRGRSGANIRVTPHNMDSPWRSAPLCLPDLTDPATIGCLLALVREAWNGRHAGVTYDPSDAPTPYWLQVAGVDHPDAMDGVWYCSGASYACALVAALEAAP